MAKPIPYNRRWLQNQQAQQTQHEEVAAAAREQRARLAALICEMLHRPQPDDDFDPVALVQEHLESEPHEAGEIISARYEGRCVGCGEPIRIGSPITRHPLWEVWVHAGCRNRQQRAVADYTLVARYYGTCRYCRQPISPGERITRHSRYGWVHEACAQQLSNDR